MARISSWSSWISLTMPSGGIYKNRLGHDWILEAFGNGPGLPREPKSPQLRKVPSMIKGFLIDYDLRYLIDEWLLSSST